MTTGRQKVTLVQESYRLTFYSVVMCVRYHASTSPLRHQPVQYDRPTTSDCIVTHTCDAGDVYVVTFQVFRQVITSLGHQGSVGTV